MNRGLSTLFTVRDGDTRLQASKSEDTAPLVAVYDALVKAHPAHSHRVELRSNGRIHVFTDVSRRDRQGNLTE